MFQSQRLILLGSILILGLGVVVGLSGAWLIIREPRAVIPPSPEQPKTIVVAGDISCEPGTLTTDFACKSTETAALVAAINPDAVLTAGDNQYHKGTLTSFQEAYDKTWGAFKDKTFPTPGNHDYETPGAAGYFDYFGDRAGEKDKGYYRFSLGDWQIYALNSEIDVSAASPQLSWLKQELAQNPSTCSLAYWHKPRFSTGGHASDSTFDALWRVLYDNNVDIVINGHSHGYERFVAQNPDGQPDAAKGITEFVSGMGGYGPQTQRSILPTLATRQNHSFGVLQLALYKQKAAYSFEPITSAQTFSDAGTVQCH